MKKFRIQRNIGKARYVVSFHDGIKTHADGSEFWDIAIFKNKRTLHAFLRKLREEGYTE